MSCIVGPASIRHRGGRASALWRTNALRRAERLHRTASSLAVHRVDPDFASFGVRDEEQRLTIGEPSSDIPNLPGANESRSSRNRRVPLPTWAILVSNASLGRNYNRIRRNSCSVAQSVSGLSRYPPLIFLSMQDCIDFAHPYCGIDPPDR